MTTGIWVKVNPNGNIPRIGARNLMGKLNPNSSFIETEGYLNNLLNKKIIDPKIWVIDGDGNHFSSQMADLEDFQSYIDSVENLGFGITTKYMKKMFEFFQGTQIKRKDHRVNKFLKSHGYSTELIHGNRGLLRRPIPMDVFITKQILLKNSVEKTLQRAKDIEAEKIQDEKNWEVFSASKKLQWIADYTITQNCAECGGDVKFPKTTDSNGKFDGRHSELAFGIYNSVWSDMAKDGSRVKFCRSCQAKADKYNYWRIDKLVDYLKSVVTPNIKEAGVLGIKYDNVIDFCSEYRFDNRVVDDIKGIQEAFEIAVRKLNWKRAEVHELKNEPGWLVDLRLGNSRFGYGEQRE